MMMMISMAVIIMEKQQKQKNINKISKNKWNKNKKEQGPVSWRPTTVSDDSVHSPTIPPSALDRTEYHEALLSSANVLLHLTS